MDGVVAIDKPAGMTSHDVVDEVRRRLGISKVGHGGTLDPDATGVLVVGAGRATRFLSYAQRAPKRYAAAARFGTTTTTQDASGDVLEHRPCSFDRVDLDRAIGELTGEIRQTPPMVSAIKVGGERLYKKALRGEEIERPARAVTIYELSVTDFAGGPRPEARLDVRCSSGTYVRTLVHDIGARLGCGAHIRSLRRTEAGGWGESDLVALDELGASDLQPLAYVVRELPAVEVDELESAAVANGRPLTRTRWPVVEGSSVAIIRSGRLLAVYRWEEDRLVAERVVARGGA